MTRMSHWFSRHQDNAGLLQMVQALVSPTVQALVALDEHPMRPLSHPLTRSFDHFSCEPRSIFLVGQQDLDPI